jgi:hypothetical protein
LQINIPCYQNIQLKEKYRTAQQGGLFGGLLKAEQFVAVNLSSSYDQSVSFLFYLQKFLTSICFVASTSVHSCLLHYALLLGMQYPDV